MISDPFGNYKPIFCLFKISSPLAYIRTVGKTTGHHVFSLHDVINYFRICLSAM